MKEPINFVTKLFNIQCNSHTGNDYKLKAEDDLDENERVVWAFKQPDNTCYCLAVTFDWDNEIYKVKKAINGDGNLWTDDNIHKGPISKTSLLTEAAFVTWMKNIITTFEHEYNN